jgi:threonine synthase
MMSYLTHLECSNCASNFPAGILQSFCKSCNAPLLARYDLASARQELDRELFSKRGKGMWRWKELLPVLDPENIVSLGEGDTPLLPVPRLGNDLNMDGLFVKEESLNPTGTFKARGLSSAVSKARELGVSQFVIPTAGNAGGALAAYAAHARLDAFVFMPGDSPETNIRETRMAGADLFLVDGLISDAANAAAEQGRSQNWFDVSTFKEPYRVEGKKIMGYELAEAFSWELPDVIVYPAGGGTGLVGMWKAFAELEELGWLEKRKRPRMVAVQAEGCAPIVKAFDSRAKRCEFWENAHTIASGLRVPLSFADQLILAALQESDGRAVAVRDEAILKAQKQMSVKEGIFPAPEGAATLVALEVLIEEGWINSTDRVVLFNTGSGLKYLS